MQTFGFAELESRLIKYRFLKAASEGLLLPVFDTHCQLNVAAVKENRFTKQHVFVLRDIFKHQVRDKSYEEILEYANSIISRMLQMREIYERLDSVIADKKEKGIY